MIGLKFLSGDMLSVIQGMRDMQQGYLLEKGESSRPFNLIGTP